MITNLRLQKSYPHLPPVVILCLACGPSNANQHVRGYSAFQWAYGCGDPAQDADSLWAKHFLGQDSPASNPFAQMQGLRQQAEAVNKKVRAEQRLSHLKNAKSRPVKDFRPD